MRGVQIDFFDICVKSRPFASRFTVRFYYIDPIFGLTPPHPSLSYFFSGHQLGAAPASPSSCHPHGPARGPSPAATACVPALSTGPAVIRRRWDWSARWWRQRWWRGRPFGVWPAATAGASDPEAEAADPAADPHRRVPAAARAAVSPTWGPTAGAHKGMLIFFFKIFSYLFTKLSN